MKKIVRLTLIVIILSFCSFITMYAQQTPEKGLRFISTDTVLVKIFDWAKKQALCYKGSSLDPVGSWYESALPPREAFCMRDVSHQCIGAEILNLTSENKNMFMLFAKNISENKDWCTFWEINRYNKPCPDDNRNDKEFWYNLPSNFDIVYACWRLYLWTGDITYLNDPILLNFYQRTTNEYIKKWHLEPESLLVREPHLNIPSPYNSADPYHRSRGLSSYNEGVQDLVMGVDLVASIYRGLLSYSSILQANGNTGQSKEVKIKARAYLKHLDNFWWDSKSETYYTYYTKDHRFGRNEIENTFLLWFNAINDTIRKNKTINRLNNVDYNWFNIEGLSYLPLAMYEQNYSDVAYYYLKRLSDSKTKRREYPEVSFAVIEAIVRGIMGIDPNAVTGTISTLHRSSTLETSEIRNLTVLGTTIDVSHFGNSKSTILNKGNKPIKWHPMFMGDRKKLFFNNKRLNSWKIIDSRGNSIVYTEVTVAPGEKITVSTTPN